MSAMAADLQKSSQRISLGPTMFRATCDNSVTTSPPASPPTADPGITKCPPTCPVCNQTRPRQPSPLPHPRHASRSSHPITTALPSASPPPAAPIRVIPLPTRHSRACRPQDQCASPAWPHTAPAPHPGMSKVTTRPAHPARSPTLPMRADDGDQYRVIVAPDDSPLPGSPAIGSQGRGVR
jgi:hypothetical protein